MGSAQAKLAVFYICKARAERMWEGQLLAPGVLAALFWPESTSTSAIGPFASCRQSGMQCLLSRGLLSCPTQAAQWRPCPPA